jgi:hypothetical protein
MVVSPFSKRKQLEAITRAPCLYFQHLQLPWLAALASRRQGRKACCIPRNYTAA